MSRCRHDEDFCLWQQGVTFVMCEKEPGEESTVHVPEPELGDGIEFECRTCGFHWKGNLYSRRCPNWLRELALRTWQEAKALSPGL